LPEIKIDKLLRSPRKTISLQITSDARLIVRAPYLASEDYIYQVIRKKTGWIRAKQDYFLRRQNTAPQRTFVPGEEFMFLGQSYALKASEELPKAIVFDGDSLMVSAVVLENAREHLEFWYKERALEYMREKCGHYARLAGLTYKSVRISGAKTLWGSCGYKDTLNFSWRLIMAPVQVVDYVIVHELMHLKHRNHSRRFWAEVGNMMPDYRQKEHWLKQNGHLLNWPV
jgi:predicted metal-dependent hydrolase